MSGHLAVRALTQDDVPALTALLAADRDHLAPWDPLPPDGYGTEEFQRHDTARLPDLHRSGAVPRYLCIAGRWQDQVRFRVLHEPGMR